MSNLTQGVMGTRGASKPEVAVGALPMGRLFELLKEFALATPLALMINSLRNRG